jgi:AcrR family transcriptional regulator
MELRKKILDATASLTCETGLDQVTMSAVCKHAGVARGSLYANFESPAAIASESWLLYGDEWLDALIALDFEAIDPKHRALVFDGLLSGPRQPELYEVIRAMLFERIEDHRTLGEWKRDEWVSVASLGIGTFVLGIANMSNDIRAVETMHRSVARMASRPLDGKWPEAVASAEAATLSHKPVTTEERLVSAAARVIATSGVHNASILRICRLARLSAGSVPAHFPNLHDLIEHTFEVTLEEVIAKNYLQYLMDGFKADPASELARNIRNSLRPERKLWREMRRELILASRTNARLQGRVMRALDNADNELVGHIVASGMPEGFARPLIAANRVFGVGLSLMADYEVPVEDTRFNFITHWVLNELNAITEEINGI